MPFVQHISQNPSLPSPPLPSQVSLDPIQITQFTYFQQVAGLESNPLSLQITYPIQPLPSYIHDKQNLFHLQSTHRFTLTHLFLIPQYQHSVYTF
ncbi:glycine--tRNA ligase subunit alpha, partial [Bacillus sp. WP8]|uniref:glycine--tRNA ligase subunit alpha n=1 Tax=Bacillus sp. WP8 TaxID=756828 RepID=UPI0037BFDA3D